MARRKGYTKATKTQLAQIKSMQDQGISENKIAKYIGLDNRTIGDYLANPTLFADAEVQAMIDVIKRTETNDLYLLGIKARKRLHELLDEGNTKVIETVALMDRSFQQRRLLEGASTHNVSIFSRVVQESMAKLVQKVDVKVCDTTEQ